MRAAFCQDCGTYVPKDIHHCPKCHVLKLSRSEAERFTSDHPENDSLGKKSRRSGSTQVKWRFPRHCRWCGVKLRWGEKKKEPGTWIGLVGEDVQRPIYYPGLQVGWSFTLLNRDQIVKGGNLHWHSCSPKKSKSSGKGAQKFAEYIEAFE